MNADAALRPTWTICSSHKDFAAVRAVILATEARKTRGFHRVRVTSKGNRRHILATDCRRIHIAYSDALPPLGTYDIVIRTRSTVVLALCPARTAYNLSAIRRVIADLQDIDPVATINSSDRGLVSDEIPHSELWAARLTKEMAPTRAIGAHYIAQIPPDKLHTASATVRRPNDAIAFIAPDFEAFIMPFNLFPYAEDDYDDEVYGPDAKTPTTTGASTQ